VRGMLFEKWKIPSTLHAFAKRTHFLASGIQTSLVPLRIAKKSGIFSKNRAATDSHKAVKRSEEKYMRLLDELEENE